jgi:hydrogenase maturation factor
VANEGIFLSVVDASVADDFVKKLQEHEFGQEAAIIGEVVALTSATGYFNQ